MTTLLLAVFLAAPAPAKEPYGARGIFPVYETAGQWLIFDKRPGKNPSGPLAPGKRFLVVGSAGAEVFSVARTSGTYGGACRGRKPLRLRAALLKGPRAAVGRPLIGIAVPDRFSLKGSKAVYRPLKNEVAEADYARLDALLKASALEDLRSGLFRLRADDADGAALAADPKAEQLRLKLDFGARLEVAGLGPVFAFVEETEYSMSSRRCLRAEEGGRLLGKCVEMPRALMAETALLQFVAYDPSGRGQPLLLAFTPEPPLWGDERWGFQLRAGGPRLLFMDAMDPRCREGF